MPKVNVKTLNEVSDKIREYEVETTSKYAVFYAKNQFSAEKIELTDKMKLCWDDDQTPFFHFGSKMYQCHHGKDINEYQKRKYAQHRDKLAQEDHCFIKRYKQAQTSKKLGCPANIYVIRIIKMFEYKLTGPTDQPAKKKVSRLIKKKIAEGVPIGEEMFVINFPNEDDHKYHLQGDNAAAVEPVDQRVREHVEKLVFRGEKNPIVVSKLLEIFVEQQLQEIERKRRRFYPDLETVRNIISRVKGKLKQSPIDQVNTEVLLGKIDSKHNVFFRGFTREESGGEQSNLLFVYQSSEMSSLYKKYGSNTILLDATYRTCKYALPLYFIVVQTNVNYQIVGVMITQFETKELVTEGLTIFKSWNEDIHPKYGMVDYAMEEISSLETVFPSMKVFICTFHREQAWARWLSKAANSNIPKQECLGLLRQIANAATREKMESALQTLQEWDGYKNSHFKRYFDLTWHKELERWAAAYKPFDMHINTNNGVERLNKELKYNYLEGFKNCSLSELINLIVFNFLPERYAKYTSKNLMMSSQYRKYGDNIPPYLQGRPKWLIDHIISRISSVNKTSNVEEVIEVDENEFMIRSMTSLQTEYKVKFNVNEKWCSCTCADFSKERLMCKHIISVGYKFPKWCLQNVIPWLLNDPVFKFDNDLIASDFVEASTSSNENSVEAAEEQSDMREQLVENRFVESSDFENIPLRGSKRKNIINDCSATMRSIQSALWYVKEEKELLEQHTYLKEILANITSKISVDDICGLPIQPDPPKKLRRDPDTDQPTKKYRKLPLNKQKKSFSGRVGFVADQLKSASKVGVPFNN